MFVSHCPPMYSDAKYTLSYDTENESLPAGLNTEVKATWKSSSEL